MIDNPALTMERERRPILGGRATLDPFETLAGGASPLQHRPPEQQSSSRSHGIAFVAPACFDQGVLGRRLVPLSRGGKHRSGTAQRRERDR
jgi:hypothetical protein